MLSVAATASAQQEPTFRTDVELRQIEVRVEGKLADPLSSADFSVFENGVQQSITAVDYVPEPAPAPRELTVRGVGRTSADPRRSTPPLWVFVLLQASPEDFGNVLRGVKKFVEKDLREGMRVSIGGLPFSQDRQSLLDTVERMRRRPFGQSPDEGGRWLPPTIDFTEPSVRSMEADRETAFDPRTEPRQARLPNARLTTDFDQQIEGYYRVVLESYVDLVREMAALPGKKAVVLFRGGLRADVNNLDVLKRAAGEAVRARVSFYAADSRGAMPMLPVADGFNQRRVSRLRGPTGAGGRETLSQERQSRFSQSQQGLTQLAEMTGGRAVLDSNDLSLVFRRLAEDAGDYYLVSYSPVRNPDDDDVRRRVEVRLSRNGLKPRYPDVYYDP